MTESAVSHLKGALEALLFVSEKPLTLDQLKDVVEGTDGRALRDTLEELKREYVERNNGITIVEIAGGYQMLSNPVYVSYVKKLFHSRHKERLSRPALESLAIVAYKQPISRQEIEIIRGVNCDGVVNHLLGRELVEIKGRKDVPGRPYLYGTTKQFLEYFGLKSLDDLPRLEDFPALVNAQESEAAPEDV